MFIGPLLWWVVYMNNQLFAEAKESAKSQHIVSNCTARANETYENVCVLAKKIMKSFSFIYSAEKFIKLGNNVVKNSRKWISNAFFKLPVIKCVADVLSTLLFAVCWIRLTLTDWCRAESALFFCSSLGSWNGKSLIFVRYCQQYTFLFIVLWYYLLEAPRSPVSSLEHYTLGNLIIYSLSFSTSKAHKCKRNEITFFLA